MRRVGAGVATLIVVLLVVVAPATGRAAAAPPHPATTPAPREGTTTSALDDLEDRFLTTRPPVGPTHVVTIAGESAGRILTARTLQGIVNRSSARLYLIDGGDPAAASMLARYVGRGLVTVTGTSGLDGALDQFGSELSGYVLADPAEPWSVHGAAVIAGLAGAVVATEDQVAGLEARGLAEIDDTRGRWPDAVTAYQDLAETYGDALASRTMAVVRPSDTLWDFVVQQGILPVFTRPSDPSWPAVSAMFGAVPDGSPVYGYLSDTGDEEAIAVATLASTNLALVPTDTTRNLSFHVAVGADQPRVPMATPAVDAVAPCTADTVNVVVGLTDGDNMNVPLNHFLRPSNWDAPNRGDLPLGWSIGPDLAVLAPAAWDGYALEATDRDELVAMIGWAYSAPALLADPADFYETSFAMMDELGMRTFWSLGGGLDTASSPTWSDLDAAAGDATPSGVLVGYGNGTGSAFHSPAGRPAFTSRSEYSETPADLAGHLDDLLATPADQRPIVSFLSATNWSNPAGELIDALLPYDGHGVRFLTPAEASACMPDPPEPPEPPTPRPGECLPTGPIVTHGLELISAPTAALMASEPTAFPMPATATATPVARSGDTIDYTATIHVDLAAIAQRTLDERIRPTIEAGYGPELAATAWQTSAYTDLTIPFPMPTGTTATGTPVVVAAPEGVGVAWSGDAVPDLVVTIPEADADTRAPAPAFDVTVAWSARAEPVETATDVHLVAGAPAFDLTLDIGVLLGATPITGGATATWACLAQTGVLATTTVVTADPDPVDPDPVGPDPDPAPDTEAPATAAPSTPPSDPGAAAPASAVRARPAFTG